jgi:hypothetical protein
MSYCITYLTSMTLLWVLRCDFVRACWAGGQGPAGCLIREGGHPVAGIDGHGYVRGRLVRSWTSRGAIRQLRGGANL